jgi:RNA polymerase sigma-70 factor (ECF subfamily)
MTRMAERPAQARHESAGHRRAIVGRLYDSHGAALYRYALMLLADPAAAEDAVQQVFTALLRPGAARVIDHEAHYLRRAVRNECYSSLRRRAVRDEVPAVRLEPAPDSAAVSPEERLALERALGALPVEQREVVHLHVFDGFTFREIAEQAGESINTVASRYRYGLAALRSVLGDER